MASKKVSVICVADIVTQPLLRLAAFLPGFDLALEHADIDQHVQVLLSGVTPDVLISHATAEFFLGRGDGMAALDWAAQYCAAVDTFAARGKNVVILNTIAIPDRRIVGAAHVAQLRLVARINEMLFTCADKSSLVSVIDLAAVLARVGLDKATNIQNDLVMRVPYTGHVTTQINREYARAIRERFVPRKKVVVLDGDNTLWGGILGEDGVDGIEVGSQFPGLVHRKFQEQLREVRASGVLLTLASKNNEGDVREAFAKLRMPLTWEDFTATRVNWEPKSRNIEAMATELNLGVDSFVFIDDNNFELEEVRHALPAVDCYAFDARKPAEALSLLARITDLNTWVVTAEDLDKARLYQEEAEREQLRKAAGSLADYLRSLQIRIEVGHNRTSQVQRISQLTNKTNQFNLTTRRYSEAQIRSIMASGDVFDFRVIDRFGDMGIVGVVIVRGGEIDTFLMSCRALGRQIEGLMLKHVRETMRVSLRASYIPTPKNGMVSEFYEKNGFALLGTESGVKHYRFIAPAEEEFIAEIHEVTA